MECSNNCGKKLREELFSDPFLSKVEGGTISLRRQRCVSIEECGRLNNGPPGMSMTHLWNLNFADVIKLGILRCPCRKLFWWAQWNHRVLLKGSQEDQSQKRCDDRGRGWHDTV